MKNRVRDAWRTRRAQVLLPCLLIASIVVAWLTFVGIETTRSINVTAIQPAAGRSYIAPLPPPDWPLEFHPDDAARPRRSSAQLSENAQPIGPGNSYHSDIETKGRGRYSHLGPRLWFSTSDNTDPRTNGRAYAVVLPSFLDVRILLALSLVTLFFAALDFRAVQGAGSTAMRFVWRIPGIRWLWRHVLPNVLISVILLALLVIAGEIYLRQTTPFYRIVRASDFNPRYGWVFTPDSIVRWTNHLDFWSESKANSLGFLDREPPAGEENDACRVAFIGDSFVEAAQVQIDDKFHVVFEDYVKQSAMLPKVRTMAFGFSGTGQINQLPYYDEFARQLKPKVVVLVVIANNFSNNSPSLEFLRYGWEQGHAPRLFFVRDPLTAIVRLAPIDPRWQEFVLADADAPPRITTRLHRTLLETSQLYVSLIARLALLQPRLESWLDERKSPATLYRERQRYLQERGLADFANWNYPDDWDPTTMFFAPRLAPVFQEALTLTGHALDEYVARAERDGFRLLILASDTLSTVRIRPDEVERIGRLTGNPLEPDAALRRLTGLARERGIPVIDQGAYIRALGGDLRLARFKHDGHWNVQGHRWAAQALFDYFRAHPELCAPAR